MAAGSMEQRLGSLTIFTQEDFEDDWRQIASGGFSRVFQARHRRWRTQYAIKCSPSPQQDDTRYLWPVLLPGEKLRLARFDPKSSA